MKRISQGTLGLIMIFFLGATSLYKFIDVASLDKVDPWGFYGGIVSLVFFSVLFVFSVYNMFKGRRDFRR